MQIRDAVIAMLNDWIGDSGRVPVERLASAVLDTLTAPKMSPEVPPSLLASRASLPLLHRCCTCRCCCTCCCGNRVLPESKSKLSLSSLTVSSYPVSGQQRRSNASCACCGWLAPGAW